MEIMNTPVEPTSQNVQESSTLYKANNQLLTNSYTPYSKGTTKTFDNEYCALVINKNSALEIWNVDKVVNYIKTESNSNERRKPWEKAIGWSTIPKGPLNRNSSIQHSGLICIRFKIRDSLTRKKVQAALTKDPFTHVLYHSPKGKVVDVVVKTNCLHLEQHSEFFEQLLTYFTRKYNCSPQELTGQNNKSRYELFHDPNVYYYPASKLFDLEELQHNAVECLNHPDADEHELLQWCRNSINCPLPIDGPDDYPWGSVNPIFNHPGEDEVNSNSPISDKGNVIERSNGNIDEPTKSEEEKVGTFIQSELIKSTDNIIINPTNLTSIDFTTPFDNERITTTYAEQVYKFIEATNSFILQPNVHYNLTESALIDGLHKLSIDVFITPERIVHQFKAGFSAIKGSKEKGIWQLEHDPALGTILLGKPEKEPRSRRGHRKAVDKALANVHLVSLLEAGELEKGYAQQLLENKMGYKERAIRSTVSEILSEQVPYQTNTGELVVVAKRSAEGKHYLYLQSAE